MTLARGYHGLLVLDRISHRRFCKVLGLSLNPVRRGHGSFRQGLFVLEGGKDRFLDGQASDD
jgi:hypothetical protein